MRVFAAPVVAALALLLLVEGIALAQDRPIVAVFQVEDKSGKLSAKAIDQLTDYLGSLLGSRGYRVVPRSQLRERLVEAKKGSFKECFDQSCQIEIGKELAAQKSLASQVLKIGAKCKILVNLFDLRQAASDGSGTATGECTEDGVVVALEQAVEAMLGGAAVGVDLPGPGSTAPATDDKKAYRQELEKAWVALAGAVRKLGPQEQLERYQAFLADYPVDNPYSGKVQKAVEGLEARLDKEAAAKRKAEEKAAALEAERQRAAELKKAYDELKALTGPAAGQLDSWKKFLADYPDRNPYMSTAKRKMADLEAQAKKEFGRVVAEVKNGMARIPAGEFLMGCSPGDGECAGNEKPAHKVWVSEFWMDATEVTVAQYRACVDAGKCSAPKTGGSCTWNSAGKEQHPINCVDWSQATEYCASVGKRLPTEAEWEKAARGGTTGARYGNLDAIAWYAANSGGSTHPVGKKQPNAYGLYDMLGNVWEWCADWYSEGYYKDSPGRDPSGPSSGEFRVLQGGSWRNEARSVRAAYRGMYPPGGRDDSFGFRCAGSAAPAP